MDTFLQKTLAYQHFFLLIRSCEAPFAVTLETKAYLYDL